MTTTQPVGREKERNAVRSREDLLDAAERLFAERGYEETSLSDVGREAGLSRAAPGYFFGSKSELHRAVLERCFEEVRAAVRVGRDRALASGESPDVIVAGVQTNSPVAGVKVAPGGKGVAVYMSVCAGTSRSVAAIVTRNSVSSFTVF